MPVVSKYKTLMENEELSSTQKPLSASGDVDEGHYLIAALYRFVPLPDYREWRDRLYREGLEQSLCGTLLLAEEGINGTVAGDPTVLRSWLESLQENEVFSPLDIKYSQSQAKPFQRWKVKLKKEIVTMGVQDTNPLDKVGTYVEPEEWNELIQREDVLLIDTRNHYETAIGIFKGARDPDTETFREFPQWVDENDELREKPKLALYCTGGIRCEKATHYLLEKGFKEVYHLKGGILKYLETVPPDESLWEGDCFVFDERVAVQPDLSPAAYWICPECQMPVPKAEKDAHQCVKLKRKKYAEEKGQVRP